MILSASRRWLARLCLFSFRPDVPSADVPNRDTALGNVKHAAFAGAMDATAFAALKPDEQDDVMACLAVWTASEWSRPKWLHEIAFAYDVVTDTARILPSKGHRDYSDVRATETCGTADLVCDDAANDRVLVPDLKTGSGFGDRTPAAEHAQLADLALFAARHFGRSRAVVYLLDVTAAGVDADSHEYDEFDLAAHAAEVRRHHEAIPMAQPTPGAHCGDCPAAISCPVAVARSQALSVVEPTALTITNDNAGGLYERLRAVEKVCEQLDAALKTHADAGGLVRLTTGKVVVRKQTKGDRYVATKGQDGAQTEGVLQRHGLLDAVKRSVPLKALPKVVVDELDAAGLIRRGDPETRWTVQNAPTETK